MPLPRMRWLAEGGIMKCVTFAMSLAVGAVLAPAAAAQDPIKSNPGVYHLVFENPSVRVLHVKVNAGAKTAVHEHPDTVIVPLSDSKVRFTGADGKPVDVELKAEQAMWSAAEKHSGQNLEEKPVEVILVELKSGANAGAATIPLNRPEMKIAPFFDNARVMAYKATTGPNFHEPAGSTHEFDQVVIALGDSNAMSVNVEGKVKTQWKRGDTLFIGRGMKHESKNSSGNPLDVIVVAIK